MSYYGRNSYGSSNTSWGGIAAGIVLLAILTFGMKSCSRSEAHMIYLSDGYAYHEESHIIYIESETGRYGTRTSYAVYYDENGKKNKYDPETDEWIPMID